MSLINISHLTFAYPGSYDNVFTDISFQIDTDWKLGFIGRNGRGKTTLLQLLLGRYPYEGSITASAVFDYFPFAVENEEQSTLRVLESFLPGCERWRIDKELSLLSVAEDALNRPFRTLCGGEQTRVTLAALFLKPARFQLIDEPTNHLDLDGRRIVSDYLNMKKGFILVSHDRMFLDGCVDHILSFNKAGIEVEQGNFSSWQANKALRDAYETAENEKLKKDIERLACAAARTAHWSDKIEKTKRGAADKGYIGHQAAKMMKRSKAIEQRRTRAAEEKASLLKNIETADSLSIHPVFYPKNVLIECSGLSILYGSRTVCDNINFTLRRGDRAALCGSNGCGKSSILKLLMGQRISFSGRLSVGSGLRISYVPQDTSFLSGGLKDFILAHSLDETLFKTILRKLDFPRIQFEKDMRNYSAGQRKKVMIAKSLCEQAHLYIWDEPLNYIDVLSRMQIEDLIVQYQPTMLFVEHDAAFISHVATQRISLDASKA